jgi:hypothetical protein
MKYSMCHADGCKDYSHGFSDYCLSCNDNGGEIKKEVENELDKQVTATDTDNRKLISYLITALVVGFFLGLIY